MKIYKSNNWLVRFICLLGLVIVLIGFIACSRQRETNIPQTQTNVYAPKLSFSEREVLLWGRTVRVLLSQPLWKKRDISDTAQSLMVPLHAAFRSDDEQLRQEFAAHFRTFIKSQQTDKAKFDENDLLEKLEYLYLASQYMVLSSECNTEVPDELYKFVLNEVLRAYSEFGGPWANVASKNMKSRIELIISREKILDKKYYRAISDFEFFTLAIMCDLLTVDRLLNKQNTSSDILKEASELVYLLFKSEAIFSENGGWVFQPGVWSDHPNYEYAGNDEIMPNLQPILIEDIAMDSSHFHRMPLHLHSFKNAQKEVSEKMFFDNLIGGLKKQLVYHVLVSPTSEVPRFRMNNYMSGNNGVFRYSYHVEGVGYGPFQLSRTLLFGWWAFLYDEEISNIYKRLSLYFPFDDMSKKIYCDPVTVREQNIYYDSKKEESEWLIELICSLASKIH